MPPLSSNYDYKSTLFANPSPTEYKALEHLSSAVTTVDKVTTKADVTLGILGDVIPLVNKFKKINRVRDDEDGGGGSRSRSNSLESLANLSNLQPSASGEDGDAASDGDAMNFDEFGNLALSPQEKQLHDYVESEFLRLSRDPKTKKPNFRQVFEEMDEDGSGRLDYGELRMAMIRLGIVLNEEQVSGRGRVCYKSELQYAERKPTKKHRGAISRTPAVTQSVTQFEYSVWLTPCGCEQQRATTRDELVERSKCLE